MKFEFVESPLFSSYVSDYLADDEYSELQGYLCEHPDAGDMVKGSGGVRVCYYVRTQAGQVLMLVIYAKSAKDSIPGHILKSIKEAMEDA